MQTSNAIEVAGLGKQYPGFTLENINFRLPTGSILGLVGANGAGKTTLIKLLMNTTSRQSGQVKLMGIDNQSTEFSKLKQDIGVVLDEAYFPEVLTAKHVDTIMKRTYQNWDSQQFSRYLSHFALPVNKAFQNFSRGMKMKLAIAVALSHAPKLLILDEATSGLDPMVREEILELLSDFTRDESHSILLSSHIVSDLEKICDYISFLHQGRLVLWEEKDRLLTDYALLNLSHENFQAIPPQAIVGKRENVYGIQALVRRRDVNPAFVPEHTTLEDIILFFAKEGGDVQ